MITFEIPYNFDLNLIKFLKCLDPKGETIDCIYIPPFYQDYKSILRTSEQAQLLDNMTWKEYLFHINYINLNFPNKIQLLLQKQDQILYSNQIKKYINLNISKFCVGTIKQAKIIKEINNNFDIVGSITLNINKEKILNNLNYNFYFNSFVLPFYYNKNLKKIKELPKNFNYILLVNALCHTSCQGQQHWNYLFTEEEKEVLCPGLYNGNLKEWKNTTLIRPMDINKIHTNITKYKLQDRGWPTEMIIRDYILYTSDYSIYPGIEYNEKFYDQI